MIANQCFGYDGLRRMTESWTTTASACQTTPTTGAIGGADPYWTSYFFDNVGNRKTELKHGLSGASDTTRTYTNPAAKAVRPHTLSKVDTKIGTGAPTTTDSLTYDSAGNTLSHNSANYTWNDLGKLAQIAVSGGPTTTFVQDADGNRLLRKDTTGTTVYLGTTELHANTPASAVTATRTYTGAVRTTAGGLTWMIADHHGTGQASIKATDLTVTRRRTDPFGGARGAVGAWPTEHGIVDGVNDPDTGLVHIGARDYNSKTGRFVSVDPIFDAGDPQSWHGYAYAGNAPATTSDPTGLCEDGGNGCNPVGNSSSDSSHHQDCNDGPCGGYDNDGGPWQPDGGWTCGNGGFCGEAGGNAEDLTVGLTPEERELVLSFLHATAGQNGNRVGISCNLWTPHPLCIRRNPDDLKGSGEAEFMSCNWMGLSACQTANAIVAQARDRATELAEANGWDNGKKNAFRHAFWMGLMLVKGFSLEQAMVLAVSHEMDHPEELVAGRPAAEAPYGGFQSRIDMYNNGLGTKLGYQVVISSGPRVNTSMTQQTSKLEAMVLTSIDRSACRTNGCVDLRGK